ncbi:MAG: HAD family hydrolase [Dehalococcoidia bacterium]|nr:HAD family hydrolase [Dehalococcoidia bacterium]
MIKAVFFDLYQTLIHYDPPREELERKVLSEFGIEVTLETIRHAIFAADEFMYQDLARLSWNKRSAEEKAALYGRYQVCLLKEAGVGASQQLVKEITRKMQQIDFKKVLFDDVKPVLTLLRERGLTLGMISNVDNDITPMCRELGLSELLQIVVTSQDVGVGKPHPEIFQEALKQAEVQADEAIYVGDQYQIDVEGANAAGMKGVLLDRGEARETVPSPKIKGLIELINFL